MTINAPSPPSLGDIKGIRSPTFATPQKRRPIRIAAPGCYQRCNVTPPASATLGDDSDQTQWRRQMDPQTQRGGQQDIGVAVATPGPLSMRRPSKLGFKKQDLPGKNEQAGEDMTRGPGRHPNEIDKGAHNEGSVDDDAVASAARCAQRPLPSRPEPTTRAPTETRPGRAPRGARTRHALPPTTTRQRPSPRGARARRIAPPPRCTAEADEIDEGTHMLSSRRFGRPVN